VQGVLELLPDHHAVVRLSAPVDGLLGFFCYEHEGQGMVGVMGHLFGPGAPDAVDDARASWAAWLENLSVPAH
jgi:hypothetical protein